MLKYFINKMGKHLEIILFHIFMLGMYGRYVFEANKMPKVCSINFFCYKIPEMFSNFRKQNPDIAFVLHTIKNLNLPGIPLYPDAQTCKYYYNKLLISK